MAQINIKIDDQLKDDVNKIFAEMGLDLTSGIKVYLKRVQQDRRIPFEIKGTRDVDEVARQYRAGNPEVVTRLNKLLSALAGPDNGATGIGGSVLKATSHQKKEQPGGIGQGILNNTHD
ncbi:type II toxin-antitoxin system antitoxin, RelB/DinJ family [Limosilactobacillus pontis]|uniref:Type II toxin-antitoxin system antitoxin, RelB/DinJ family n=1 Tax=Limosilactobacillus pontis TaxID=35787 RepID=A0A2J6NP74_9LACO|nr:type II toxin-antitoxin system RelB/DinJ family antitoxin [Limosilactobacillus pontis]PMB83121.1 type II toxin-antitoxin system antitoxin, RelB/DinJ family [Limosilactobacillus pontis]